MNVECTGGKRDVPLRIYFGKMLLHSCSALERDVKLNLLIRHD